MINDSIFALIATFGFAILFNIRGFRLVYVAFGGGIAWFTYLLMFRLLHSNIEAYFIASVVASMYAEIMAQRFRIPATIFIICSIIPLVPGGGMYNTTFLAIQGKVTESITSGIKTLAIAGSIAVGILVVSFILRILFYSKNKKKV